MRNMTEQIIATEDAFHDRLHAAYFGMQDAVEIRREEAELSAWRAARDPSSYFYHLKDSNIIEAVAERFGYSTKLHDDRLLVQLIIEKKADALLELFIQTSLEYWTVKAEDYFTQWDD